jgi:hypothetical protein
MSTDRSRPLTVALAAVSAAVLVAGMPAIAQPPTPPGQFWRLTGNAGTDPAVNFVGTTDNQPLEFRVSGQRAFRLEPGSIPNVIGGSATNTATSGVVGATIGGGGEGDCGEGGGVLPPNLVTGSLGTVSGGAGNEATSAGTVGGGCENTASGGLWPTVAGGVAIPPVARRA